MPKKIALCRVSDTEPLLSLVRMLEYAGYECVLPDRGLRDYLRSISCTNVDEFEDMRDRWGAEMPSSKWRRVDSINPNNIDLYVDVNAFHNGPLVWKSWPQLRERTLCYFINGGPPRNTSDKGDGITPACPVMTTNQWYSTNTFQARQSDGSFCHFPGIGDTPAPWRDKSYVFYPSFERWDRVVPRTPDFGGSPVCFCHNVMGWGYGEYVEAARKLGCKFYGGGSSPDGLVPHGEVFQRLATSPCVVYLKGGGAVDYAILEAMAMGVPIITPQKFVTDTRLEKLLNATSRLPEVGLIENLQRSIDHVCGNKDISFYLGEQSKIMVKELCWQSERDGPGFVDWLGRMFGDF